MYSDKKRRPVSAVLHQYEGLRTDEVEAARRLYLEQLAAISAGAPDSMVACPACGGSTHPAIRCDLCTQGKSVASAAETWIRERILDCAVAPFDASAQPSIEKPDGCMCEDNGFGVLLWRRACTVHLAHR